MTAYDRMLATEQVGMVSLRAVGEAIRAAVAAEREAMRPVLLKCWHLVCHELQHRPEEGRNGGLQLKAELEHLMARGRS